MQQYWRSLVEGRRSNPPLLTGLSLLSQLYRVGLKIPRGRPQKAPMPVVSVGNVAVGGVGKTPLVMALCEQLQGQIAVWSRFSDEARLIQQRYPLVRVYSGDRCRVPPAQLLILDDGLQQRQLQVDLQLVVLDGANPWGSGRLLPAGLLREPLEALSQADYVLVVGPPPAEFEGTLRRYTQAPWLALDYQLGQSVAGQPVGLLCAIGQPDRFFKMVEAQGAHIVSRWTLPDHAAISEPALTRFVARCRQDGAQCIVCTEKDAVKISAPLDLPLVPLPVQLKPIHQEIWQQLVAKLQFLVQTGRR
jgi:tetraacyldisaccharide 4'-kinase